MVTGASIVESLKCQGSIGKSKSRLIGVQIEFQVLCIVMGEVNGNFTGVCIFCT